VASERDLPYREPRLPSYPPAGQTAAPRPPHAPLTQRMRTGHWIAIDCVVAGFAALLVLLSVHQALLSSGMWLAAALLMAGGVFIPVALRRRAPVPAFGGLLILAVLFADTRGADIFPGAAVTAVALVFLSAAYVLYTVTVTSSRRTGAAALALALALLVFIGGTGRGRSDGAPAELVPVGLATVIAWMTGYSVRQRRLYVVRLQQQAASSAVAEERLRIARELHDVVAHSMSVIAVQAGYGQYVINDSPDGARDALGAIQVTSREALDEMRRMLGVLRQQDVTPPMAQADALTAGTRTEPGAPAGAAGWTLGRRSRPADPAAASADGALADAGGGAAGQQAGDEHGYGQAAGPSPLTPAPLTPAPGLANLDRLIERTGSAGVRVTLELYGTARPLPAGLDLSAYRIVQEALTNVVKHAGSGARCTVHLGYDEGVLAIRVTDDGGQSVTLPRYGGQGDEAGGTVLPALAPTPPAGAGARPMAGLSDKTADDRDRAVRVGAAAAGPAGNGYRVAAGWRTPSEPPGTSGHGIIGMRERAHLCGGKFSARPLAEGGFQVTASLPLPGALRAEAAG